MNRKNVITKILSILLILAAVGLVVFAVYTVFKPESAAEKRQDTEESLADAYIEAAKESGASRLETTEAETAKTTEEETTEAETDSTEPTTTFSDDIYYYRGDTTYTPDYATGSLLGVLEIDACEIRRGVYGGSWEDIEHDLGIWMVTEARPDYVLGETHFVIYGHNHPTQNLSFNRLKNLQIGQVFTFTTSDTVYVYEVIQFIADWRDTITYQIVDNFSLPADQMYIITCGREEYAVKDIVYVGKLRGTVDINTYSENPDYYKNDPTAFADQETGTEEETVTEATEAPVSTNLTVTLNDSNQVVLTCLDENGNTVPCELGVYDMDGLPVCHLDYPENDTVEEELTDGETYICGVVTMEDSSYAAPDDVVFKYHAGKVVITEIKEEETDASGLPVWVKPVVLGLAAIILVLIALILFPGKKKEKKNE